MDGRSWWARRLSQLLWGVGLAATLIAFAAACEATDDAFRGAAGSIALEPAGQLEARPSAVTEIGVAASRTPPAIADVAASSAGRNLAPASPLAAGAIPAARRSDERRQLSIPDVVELVRPSIVHIATEAVARDNSGRMVPAGGVGTGFVIDAEGRIITNSHVVATAQEIVVTTEAGDLFDARVVGRDPQTDLAVLQVDASGLSPIVLGRSVDLRIGESVVAIGHALDLPGGPTVTVGVVGALDRTITNVGFQRLTLSDLIQTDASINPGNSGGPLLNLYGEVVGVNSAGAGSASGIGFAIAIDGARPVIAELIESGQVVRVSWALGRPR